MDYKEQLKQAKPLVTLTPTPMNLDRIGDTFRGMFVGIQTFERVNPQTNEKKVMPVAHFFDGVGLRFNMGAQLTRVCANLKPGISVEVKLVELKKNQNGGQTKIYSVSPLNIPLVNIDEMFGGSLSSASTATDHLLPPPPQEPEAPIVGDEEIDELSAFGIERKTQPDPEPTGEIPWPTTEVEFYSWQKSKGFNGKETHQALGTDVKLWMRANPGKGWSDAAKTIAAVLGK